MKRIIPLLAAFCFLCPIVSDAALKCTMDTSSSREVCSMTCTCNDGTESSAYINTADDYPGMCCYSGYYALYQSCSTYADPVDCDNSEPYGGHGNPHGYDEVCNIEVTWNPGHTLTTTVTCTCFDGSSQSGTATCTGTPNWSVTSDDSYACWVSVGC